VIYAPLKMSRRLVKKTVYEYEYSEDIEELDSEYAPESDRSDSDHSSDTDSEIEDCPSETVSEAVTDSLCERMSD
jgi:hypothetical protein